MKKTLVLLLAALFAPASFGAYKCVDERGITHVGDTPPAGCAKVPMFEISRSGAVLRRIDPTPTPEQVKAREAEAERRKESERHAAEQKRKDMALLSTFSSEREFDVVRDRTIEPVKGRIASAQERIKAVETRERSLEEEMEFYKAGKARRNAKGEVKEVAPPAALVDEMERLTREKKALKASVTASEREIVQIRARFDADKKRWLEIKAQPAETRTVSTKGT